MPLYLLTPRKVFIVFILIYLFEYYIFGPYSFIGKDTDSQIAAMQYYMANHYSGGTFLAVFSGGQDAIQFFSGNVFLHLENILFTVFPPWIAILGHKAIIGSCGFVGVYLLANSLKPEDTRTALLLACWYPFSHAYLLNYSLELGTGFAAIPLAVYACVSLSRISAKEQIKWVLMSAAIMAMALPMKILPVFGLATLIWFVLVGGNFFRIAVASLFHVIASIFNWAEVLFSISKLTPETARGVGAENDTVNFIGTLEKTPGLFMDGSVALFLLASIVVMILSKDKKLLRILAGVGTLICTYVLADAFPWQVLGLDFMNRVEQMYLRLALPMIVIPAIIWAVNGAQGSMKIAQTFTLSRRQLLVAVGVLVVVGSVKINNAASYVVFGGQGSVFKYTSLSQWQPDTQGMFRSITLFDTPYSSIVAGVYNIDSFDGALPFNPIYWNDYWAAIRRGPINGKRAFTRGTLDWRYWNGKTYDIDKLVDLDLLQAANVRYLISALPLQNPNLLLVVPSEQERWPKIHRSMFPDMPSYLIQSLKRIFDPGKHYIYELKAPLPRVFPAKGVMEARGSEDPAHFLKTAAKAAQKGLIIVKSTDIRRLESQQTHFMEVCDVVISPNGYDISLLAPQGGVLVVNQHFNKFWKAYSGGRELLITPANGIYSVFYVPPATTTVRMRYMPPRLFAPENRINEGPETIISHQSSCVKPSPVNPNEGT